MDPQKIYLGPHGGGYGSLSYSTGDHHFQSSSTLSTTMSSSSSTHPTTSASLATCNDNHLNNKDGGGTTTAATDSTPATPTEITDFDSWLKVYYELVSVEKECGPQFENLKIIFNNESSMLMELFKSIQQHIEEKLKEDSQNRGSKLYGEWGRSMRKEFLISYYDNEYFRAQYARNRFLNSARTFMQALALRILPQCVGMSHYLENIRRIVSIGVGPGSDVAGFLSYMRTRGLKQRLTYFLIDQCPFWSEYIQVCDRHWSTKYNVSLWFKCARIGHMDSLNLLPEADMIVFSFSNTSLMEPSIWPVLKQRYPLIIVLDGIKEILIEGFSDCCFEKFQLNEKTNLYYTFRSPYPAPTPLPPPTTLPNHNHSNQQVETAEAAATTTTVAAAKQEEKK